MLGLLWRSLGIGKGTLWCFSGSSFHVGLYSIITIFPKKSLNFDASYNLHKPIKTSDISGYSQHWFSFLVWKYYRKCSCTTLSRQPSTDQLFLLFMSLSILQPKAFFLPSNPPRPSFTSYFPSLSSAITHHHHFLPSCSITSHHKHPPLDFSYAVMLHIAAPDQDKWFSLK